MNRLKKTYEKRNATQPKMNHKSHIQHIQTLTNEMEQLREREHRLAERLISEQPLINELRHSPRFIKETDKSCLAALVDDVYNNFTNFILRYRKLPYFRPSLLLQSTSRNRG